MTFSTLISLTNLIKTTSQREEPSHQDDLVNEARNRAADFNGIQSIVSDSLSDLSEKVELLMDLAKDTGAARLDTVKDKDGLTVFKKIDRITRDYTSAMQKLMAEAEVMIMQVVESRDDLIDSMIEANHQRLTEGKNYDDSAEFTDEFYGIVQKVNDIKRVVKAPRFMNWMKATDHNFGTGGEESCVTLGGAVIESTNDLAAKLGALEDKLHAAE